MRKNFSKRELGEFNKFREFFQKLVCSWTLGTYLKLAYKVEFQGRHNIKKDNKFIAVANHISGYDPFIVCDALSRSVAFMAKQELFEKFFSRKLMDYCGAFAVNREKMEVSTLKTALSIKNTKKWSLGIFPQGTREEAGQMSNITKGFASLAKATKTDILPVAIIGSDTKASLPIPFFNKHKNKITVKIGEIIPYSDDIEDMMQQWVAAIKKLTECEYVRA